MATIPVQASLTPDHILQLGLGFWGSKTLLRAVELGLFTALASGPKDADAIMAELALHPRGTRDFLDTLVALGMLRREEGQYGNSAETDLFLDRNKPSYLGGLLEMANARLYHSWGSLTEGLRTGLPQNEIKRGGGNPFDRLYEDPDVLRQFLSAMTGVSLGAAQAIAAKFPWNEYKTFIDIGCAQGGLPVQLALAHPHLQGGGYDLAAVRPVFEEYISRFGLSERLRFSDGSFFTDPMPSANVLVMGHILHLIVYEAIIDDDRSQNAFGLLMSLNMLIETPGGFDYTGADCKGWMHSAGFRETRVEHLVGPDSMVIGIK